jgi:hypothetical protein
VKPDQYPDYIFLSIKKDEEYAKLEKLAHILIDGMLTAGVLKKSELESMSITYDSVRNLYLPVFHITYLKVRDRTNTKHDAMMKFGVSELYASCPNFSHGPYTVPCVQVCQMGSGRGKAYDAVSEIMLPK